MPHRKYISLIFSPEGGGQSFAMRLRRWQVWILLTGFVVGWMLLFMGILGTVLVARFVGDRRALVAENSRLRIALTKADSLARELDDIREMRMLLEKALLVAQTKERRIPLEDNYLPNWIPQKSVFVSQRALPELAEYLDNLARVQAYLPTGLPANGVITAKFGEVGGKFTEPHTGVDIMTPRGTPIHATADGIVAYVGKNDELGNFVRIDHMNGYQTIYAHLSDVIVPHDLPVRRGDIVGHSGETGKTQHPHLHYEVRYNGEPIDPLMNITAETDTSGENSEIITDQDSVQK